MTLINDHYKNKYLKYKNKYFNLISKKNNQKGGSTEMYVLTSISLIVGLLLASLHSNNFLKIMNFNQGDNSQNENKEYIIINKSPKSTKTLIDTGKQPQNLSSKNTETFINTGQTQSLPESVPLQPKKAEKDTVETQVKKDSSIVDIDTVGDGDTATSVPDVSASSVHATGDGDTATSVSDVVSAKLPTEAIKAKEGKLNFRHPVSGTTHTIDISTNDTILDVHKKLNEKVKANTRIIYSGKEVTNATDINELKSNTYINYVVPNDSQSQKGNTDEKKEVDSQATDANDDDDDAGDDNGDTATPVSDVPATGDTPVSDVLATGVDAAESNNIVLQEVNRVNKRKEAADGVNDKLRGNTNKNAT